MAVEIFKLDNNNKIVSMLVDPSRLKANLSAGWSVDISELKECEKEEEYESDEEKVVREKAKELGISHWWIKSLDNLNKEIAEHDNED